jgi:hypothetical protein
VGREFFENVLLVFVVYGLVFGICCGWLASQKGRSVANWFITGFLLGIIGLLLIAFAPVQTVGKSSQGEARKAPISISALAKALVAFFLVQIVFRELLSFGGWGLSPFLLGISAVFSVLTAVKIYSMSNR